MLYSINSVHLPEQASITRKTSTSRVKTIGLITIAALLSLGFTSKAGTFMAVKGGNFNEESTWKPTYPGNVISAQDTVIVSANLKLTVDVIIKGTMIIRGQSSLTGEKNLVVLEKGVFMNYGTTIVDAITNRGSVINKHIMETNKDLINTGKLENFESMIVGNILDNTGTITGNGGNLIANKKFVNSQSGSIVGNVDVCSGNFMNVDGAHIDSTNVSFCGHRIFNNVFLTASLKKESVVLNLLNSQNKQYQSYTIEKSEDGTNYKTVATIKGSEIEDATAPFRYSDNELVASNTLFYRIRLLDNNGSEKVIPAVEVGNIMASRMSANAK